MDAVAVDAVPVEDARELDSLPVDVFDPEDAEVDPVLLSNVEDTVPGPVDEVPPRFRLLPAAADVG